MIMKNPVIYLIVNGTIFIKYLLKKNVYQYVIKNIKEMDLDIHMTTVMKKVDSNTVR